jgi:hypothetical protein
VLGESIAAATVAVKTGAAQNDALDDLVPVAVGGLLLVFAAWWVYFVVPRRRGANPPGWLRRDPCGRGAAHGSARARQRTWTT